MARYLCSQVDTGFIMYIVNNRLEWLDDIHEGLYRRLKGRRGGKRRLGWKLVIRQVQFINKITCEGPNIIYKFYLLGRYNILHLNVV